MKCFVVVPAAGSGSRFGGEVPKQYVSLAGRPLIAHTLSRLETFNAVEEIVVAVAEDQFQPIESIRESENLTRTRFVAGGATRAESVLLGLRSLPDEPDSIVAVHDAVRPFVTAILLDRLLAALEGSDGAFPGTPPTDTIHRIENGLVVETPSRAQLSAAQTPQCFRLGVVRRALDKAVRDGLTATDEVAAVVRLGCRVAVVEGEPDNFKITRPEDLERAERLLAAKGA